MNNTPANISLITISPKSPLSSSKCIGENYKTVEHSFRSAGFHNIVLVPKQKRHGFFHHFKDYPDDSVFSVSINGDIDYSSGNYISSDPVTITYYTDKPPDDSDTY